jgi:hypothetical protein
MEQGASTGPAAAEAIGHRRPGSASIGVTGEWVGQEASSPAVAGLVELLEAAQVSMSAPALACLGRRSLVPAELGRDELATA